MDACHEVAVIADTIAAAAPEPRDFIARFAFEIAGIRPGLVGYRDLLGGGRNRVGGRGFRSPVDDGTDGQARHFAGIAAAALRVGPGLARRLSRTLGRDAADSADGRLTDAAIVFTTQLRSGELPVASAGDWIRANLCDGR